MLAALVLLATLLVGVLKAKSDAERQRARADQRLQAVAVADALLAQWLSAPSDPGEQPSDAIPVEESGSVTGTANLAWETRIIEDEEAERLRCHLVRLSIRDASLDNEPELLMVDFLTAIDPLSKAQDAPDAALTESGTVDAAPQNTDEGVE